jgi:hypothetical protein
MSDFISLTCPHCGGQMQRLLEAISVRCPYCNTEHIFNSEVVSAEPARKSQTKKDLAEDAASFSDRGTLHERESVDLSIVCPLCKRNDRIQKVSGIVDTESENGASPLARRLTLPKPVLDDLQEPKRVLVADWQAGKHHEKTESYYSIMEGLTNPQKSIDNYNGLILIFMVCGVGGCLIWWWMIVVWDDPPWDLVCGVVVGLISMAGFLPIFLLGDAKRARDDGLELLKKREEEKQAARSAEKAETESQAALQAEQKKLDEIHRQELENFRQTYPGRQEANRLLTVQYRKKLALWGNLYYCSRDDIVFLPEDGSHATARELDQFITALWEQKTKQNH